uniref:Tyrosine specific protein phosphatases domain-containing protein n=1 Tax=Oryza brachyantha TaxID=4533 RepID=J3LGJ2_ORYBR
MRKRERETPCEICGHYHKSEEGERKTETSMKDGPLHCIVTHHCRTTVPDSQNLFRNSFTYRCIQGERNLDFDGANTFLEQCERDTSRVLVHCMSGKNRSAAIVIGFLMKSRGWRLAQCYQWVKDRRPQVQLTDASQHQLVEYEQKLFGPSVETPAQPSAPTESFPPLGSGFPKPAGDVQAPVFNQQPAASIFERVSASNVPSDFTFGAMEANTPMDNNDTVAPTSADNPMDSS